MCCMCALHFLVCKSKIPKSESNFRSSPSTLITLISAMDPAVARALQHANSAYVKDESASCIPLLERALDLCERSGCTANVPYVRTLRQLSTMRSVESSSPLALTTIDRALAMAASLDASDEAVQLELGECEARSGLVLCELGRHAESLIS